MIEREPDYQKMEKSKESTKETIILLFWNFFPPTLTDDLPLDSEWEQVSLSLQDS